MVSCFNLLFFFPMFLRYPLSFSLSRTVNPFLRLATCSPFLIILQAWNGVSHRSPRISREFPRSVNRRELIDHRPNSFSKTFRMEKWRIVSLLALSHSMQRRKDLIWIRFVWRYGVSLSRGSLVTRCSIGVWKGLVSIRYDLDSSTVSRRGAHTSLGTHLESIEISFSRFKEGFNLSCRRSFYEK